MASGRWEIGCWVTNPHLTGREGQRWLSALLCSTQSLSLKPPASLPVDYSLQLYWDNEGNLLWTWTSLLCWTVLSLPPSLHANTLQPLFTCSLLVCLSCHCLSACGPLFFQATSPAGCWSLRPRSMAWFGGNSPALDMVLGPYYSSVFPMLVLSHRKWDAVIYASKLIIMVIINHH